MKNFDNAILQIFAGAGGQDAQDWAGMLLRMYQRFCQNKGWKTRILHQSFGPVPTAVKTATLEIKGNNSYGLLKNEAGVHRLVRLSPFSAKSLRHTSFVLVEVLPQIDKVEQKNMKIKPQDLKIDTFRASGPGGQHVNKRESAVRITHLPSKTTVSCQSERLQGLNKQKAMELLYAKLYRIEEIKRQKTIRTSKTGVGASWGNQIRSYVLHPYKMVKDVRSGIKTSNVDAVLDGDLDKFHD